MQIREMIKYSEGGITSRVIQKGEQNVSLFCMAKDTEMDEHTSTKQGFVYILEGEGIFTLEGKKIKMIPGEIIFMDNNAKHSLKAEENTAFLLSLVS
jgi:nitric oxide dioxygenase